MDLHFTVQKFHKFCDNTVLITKLKSRNEILGGYNPIVWKSDSMYCVTTDSFIFSFKVKESKLYIIDLVSVQYLVLVTCLYGVQW